jgi:holo-[acyl-carrier protein] synthase
MNIIGNGVDIVENRRIAKSMKNNSFLYRIFTKNEINQSRKIKDKINFFAKRFAAKEAFVKALGTGIRNNINFKDINVKNNINGQPLMNISNNLKRLLKQKFKINKYRLYLSLSDEKKYSIAFVIINKIK